MPRRRIPKCVAFACVLAMMMAFVPVESPAYATASWSVSPLTDNGAEDSGPQVSGDLVVWKGWDGNDYEIYAWRANDGWAVNHSNIDGITDENPQVSGQRIVWEGWANATDRCVYTALYDGDTQVLDTAYSPEALRPQVSGDRVVWTRLASSQVSLDIYTWWANVEWQSISQNPLYKDDMPQVDGDRIVWRAWDGNDYEIYTWKKSDPVARNISNNDGRDDLYPQVSGDRAVWYGWDGNDFEVYTWAANDPLARNISNNDLYGDAEPQISGDRIVWKSWDGNDYEICTWAASDPLARNISNHDGRTDELPQISGNRVVWQGYDGNDDEVYTWKVGDAAPTNVSNRDGRYDEYPQVSGDRIVWQGHDGNDPEIFTAVLTGLTTTSIAGANRYATAVEVSKKAFPNGADAVVIATGENWPDALGGSALAGAMNAPILLTRKDSLPSEVVAEIRRLKPMKAVVLGSSASVSDRVIVDQLEHLVYPPGISRIGGANRYETARLIAAETVRLLKLSGGYSGWAFVTTGTNFPDALGASPLAAKKGWPIYLVNPATSVAPQTIATMKTTGVTKAIALGSTKAVTNAAMTAIGAGVPCETRRVQGANRYDTAVQVAGFGVTYAGLGYDGMAIATGQNFPDALAGGVLQGKTSSVLLLTPSTSLNATVAATLSANKAGIHEVRFLGSPAAVSNAVRAQVANALK